MALILKGKKAEAVFAKARIRSSSDITAVLFMDMVRYYGVHRADLMQGRARGVAGTPDYVPAREYVKLWFANTEGVDESINLSIGQSVTLTQKGVARLDELLDNFVLYTGQTNRDKTPREFPWFAFGVEADASANVLASKTFSTDAEEADEEIVTTERKGKAKAVASRSLR